MPTPSTTPRRTSARALGAALLGAALAVPSLSIPAPVRAQTAPAIAGGVLGLAAGTYTMAAVYVAKARAGHYLYSYDDLFQPRPELLPMLTLPVAGAFLGAESDTALWRSVGWGTAGLVVGGAVGVGVGHLLWGTSEGRWAGGIIGSALGLLGGAVAGALDGLDDGDGAPEPALSLSLRVGWRP